MEKTYTAGTIDYNGNGRANCPVTFEWSLKEGRFSLCASVWMASRRDIYMGGQCVEECAAYFPDDAQVQEMLATWRDWHLNDMKAGSPAQEAFLKANPVKHEYPKSHYEEACKALAAAGLHPDPTHERNGKPYAYGSAWLSVPLPQSVIDTISAWRADD